MKRIALALALGLVSACATPAAYGPQTKPGGPGYSEMRIEADRYRVSFNGAGSPQLATDYALRHAANLTLAAGYDHFIVDQRFVERTGGNRGPSLSVGLGTAHIGGNSAVGVGTSIGVPLGGGGGGISNATLDIRLGRGPKPAGVDAYDARQVRDSMGAAPA